MPITHLPYHYSMENHASVYDEEALTAIELAGRTHAKVNECVDKVNELAQDNKDHEQAVADRLVRQDEILDALPELIEDTAKATVIDQIKKGALDHVVAEHATDISQRLDNLILEGEENLAEVVDARTGNGGVKYATLGEAIRKQTGEVKPSRLMNHSGEWKADAVENPYLVTEGQYDTQSGFNKTTVLAEGVRGLSYRIPTGCKEMLFTCGKEITDNEIKAGYFIFLSYANHCPVIGATNYPSFVSLVDSKNWVYRLRIPAGTDALITRTLNENPAELWSIYTKDSLDWLKVDGENVEVEAIRPRHLAKDLVKERVAVSTADRAIGVYYVSNGTKIQENTAGGMCAVKVPVKAGEVYEVLVGKDVSNTLQNYFVFATAEGESAINSAETGEYVALVNGATYTYQVTIPEGAVYMYCSRECVDQNPIYQVIERVSLEWLDVKMDNLPAELFDYIDEAVKPDEDQGESNPGTSVPGTTVINNNYRVYERVHTPFAGYTSTQTTVFIYGDSIANGYASDTSTAGNGFIRYAFKDSDGASMTFDNRSVNGAKLADVVEQLKTNRPTTNGMHSIWICAGVNDWIAGTPIGNLSDVTTDTICGCMYQLSGILQTYMDAYAYVYFITPLNVTRDFNPSISLTEYRKAIFYCVQKMFDIRASVIDGSTLGMPDEVDNFSDAFIRDTDNLHPTVLGYKVAGKHIRHKMQWKV